MVIAGCGGGLASPVALRRQATDICKDTSSVSPPANPTAIDQLTAFLSRGRASLSNEVGRLGRLPASSGEVKAVYRAALGAMAAQAHALRAAAAAIQRGEDPALAFRALEQQLAPLEKQADNAWLALQIPACLER